LQAETPPIVAFQAEALRLLKSIIEQERMGHAYLFTGDVGCGALELAHSFAQIILCQKLVDGWACGSCPSCRKFLTVSHPDFLLIQAGERYIKIDEIRELKRESALNPFEGGRRVILLEEAERMNLEAANAFLKLLEEPPPSTVVLLTTAKPNLLLTTVLSRLLRINLRRPPNSVIAQQLVFEGMEQESADKAARLARGSVETARKLASAEAGDSAGVGGDGGGAQLLSSLGTIEGAVKSAKMWGKDRQKVLENLDGLSAFLEGKLGEGGEDVNSVVEEAIHGVISARVAISANAAIELCLVDLFIKLGDLGLSRIVV